MYLILEWDSVSQKGCSTYYIHVVKIFKHHAIQFSEGSVITVSLKVYNSLYLFILVCLCGAQDLQRRLDSERTERRKSDSVTLKLLCELKETSSNADELRDQEIR